MSNVLKLLTVLMVVASLVFIPVSSAFSAVMEKTENISSEAMVADLVVARPLGFASYLMGCAFYLVSLPFSVLGGNVEDTAEKFVLDTAEFTFKRPLGEF